MRIDYKKLTDHCAALLEHAGACPEHARITAEGLVEADLCGVETHGVSRMEVYLRRLEAGAVLGEGVFTVVKEYAGAALCDGGGALGQVTARKAMELACDKARTAGCYTVFVRNSSHYGMAAIYARMAAERGLVGITATNAPPALAPWGSHEAYFGPNPLAIAVPGRNGTAFCLDMAPSIIPRGKLMLAIQKGESIPEGWAVDKEGNPTTDPKLAWEGTLLPIGGPKGAGLTMSLDVLCGLIPGAALGPHIGNLFNNMSRTQDVGHVFTVIDPELFTGREAFVEQVEQMLAEIRALPRNPGVEQIYAPGEIELGRMAERKQKGIELARNTYDFLIAKAQEYGVKERI